MAHFSYGHSSKFYACVCMYYTPCNFAHVYDRIPKRFLGGQSKFIIRGTRFKSLENARYHNNFVTILAQATVVLTKNLRVVCFGISSSHLVYGVLIVV